MVNVPFSVEFGGNDLKSYAPGGFGFVLDRELSAFPALLIPEINSGFAPAWWYKNARLTALHRADGAVYAVPGPDALAEDLQGRALPLWFKADTGPGRFRLTVTLSSQTGTEEALVFVSRRRLVWRGALEAGESRTVEVLCDVSPIIAVGGGDAAVGDLGRAEDVSVDLTVLGAGLRALQISAFEGPCIFIMGDSTVTDQPAETPYAPGAAYCGWGQMLSLYTGTAFAVSNHAHSGLSTETFRERGHYDVMLPQIREGDLALIQFGHNDQKRAHLAAETGYTDNLLRYIRELRARGVRPVLVTSLARNTWKSETEYNDLLAAYALAMERIGQSEAVPVLDLHGKSVDAVKKAGMDGAKQWYHPGDYAHPNDFGAHKMAGFVAGALREAGLIPAFDVPAWPVRGPLTPLTAPAEPEKRHGNSSPGETKKLVDYGLIPDMPWPVT